MNWHFACLDEAVVEATDEAGSRQGAQRWLNLARTHNSELAEGDLFQALEAWAQADQRWWIK